MEKADCRFNTNQSHLKGWLFNLNDVKEEREKQTIKPIGLKPKLISNLERLEEIKCAIVRYYNAELKIPIEWIEEYNELIDATKNKNL